jgi:hypothetical protein
VTKLLLDNLNTIAAIVSAILTAVALFASWRSWRRSELRRDDVLDWANEAITALQSISLITGSTRAHLDPEDARKRMTELMFETSILVERGRLFFRNARSRKGCDKPRAYRGSRPAILDPLVLGHQVACAWPDANPDTQRRIGLVAEDAVRQFVSLIQAEVGRERTASSDTRRGGHGADLDWRLKDIEAAEL